MQCAPALPQGRIPMRAMLRLLVAFPVLAALAPIGALARELSFEERVEAQRAIERVYYSHQIGAKLSFEEAVPREVLQAKVRAYLDQSSAREASLDKPISLQMLDAEAARIERAGNLPDRLKEIRAALGGDPLLFRECFVRPILVERLTRKPAAPVADLDASSLSLTNVAPESFANCSVDVW